MEKRRRTVFSELFEFFGLKKANLKAWQEFPKALYWSPVSPRQTDTATRKLVIELESGRTSGPARSSVATEGQPKEWDSRRISEARRFKELSSPPLGD
jgi:hypothetical protein